MRTLLLHMLTKVCQAVVIQPSPDLVPSHMQGSAI